MIQMLKDIKYFIIIIDMKDTILVTGSKGFVGQNLVQKIKAAGVKVREVDILDNKNYSSLQEKDLKDIRYVVHLANSARITPSWKNPAHYYTNNICDTTDFYIKCQNAGVEKFLYISSSSVYGDNGTEIQSESDKLCPASPYALSKATAEQSLRLFEDTTKLVIARPFTMYGVDMPLVKNALVTGKFINNYKNNKPLVVDGTGWQKRDFILVDDATDAMLLLLELANSGVYNIGTGTALSVLELAELFDLPITYGPNRKGPEYDTCADIVKLKELGFQPTTDLKSWILEHKKNHFEELKCH